MVIDATEKLDKEWIELILTAKQIGLTPEEIRRFIRQSSLSTYRSSERNQAN